jgi:hypothetical protein
MKWKDVNGRHWNLRQQPHIVWTKTTKNASYNIIIIAIDTSNILLKFDIDQQMHKKSDGIKYIW